ncbi:MAG: amidase [Gemmatimonadota bacterium]|nr:amidase [Gemmatimonadota bacterium]
MRIPPPFLFFAVLASIVLGARWIGSPAPVSAQAPLTEDAIRQAEEILGLRFTPAERRLLIERQQFFQDLAALRDSYAQIRSVAPNQSVMPALLFQPGPLSWSPPETDAGPTWTHVGGIERPADLDDVAFWTIPELTELIRTRQVSSVELTRMYLDRVERFDRDVHAVVTRLDELAMAQAARADREIAEGRYRGPLHGIPYALKDLFALEGHPTTWGAVPEGFEQMEGTATVAKKLEAAGAVLLAKVSLGALAWGDVWFGEQTRNPWNLDEGSSGSSAGSAASVSAGLVPFAIGTETWGSIVSPSTRTGVTGLRPTFGRVSRAGGMAVSWSMDKAGPICRAAEDCGIVLDAIRGADGIDPSAVDAPFDYTPGIDWSGLTLGYTAADFEGDDPAAELDRAALDVFRSLGARLVPIELPDRPVGGLSLILGAEAAASFDRLTIENLDDRLPRQMADAWPNVLRTARFIPAAEYIQANRIRTQLGQDMAQILTRVDAYLAPSQRGDNSLITNLTGHPAISLPNGFVDPDSPSSFTVIGRLYDEATVLRIARAYQDATDFHRRHPPRFSN